jgi:hypothetical protein
MAINGTLKHRKTRALARELGIDPCFALGILEALWHVTADQTPQGDIGQMSDAEIAREIYYGGDAEKLIKALLNCGFLDSDPISRIVVHDWKDHALQYVRKRLIRKNLPFKSGYPVDSQNIVNGYQNEDSSTGTGIGIGISSLVLSSLNAVRGKKPKKSPKQKKKIRPSAYSESFLAFWAVYPRKVKKDEAWAAWLKNVEKIKLPLTLIMAALAWQVDSADWTKDDGQFIPYPGTYLNQRRWLDEPPKGKAYKPSFN